MTREALEASLNSLKQSIKEHLPETTAEEAKMAVLILLGIDVIGGLLLDIKRIADASEKK